MQKHIRKSLEQLIQENESDFPNLNRLLESSNKEESLTAIIDIIDKKESTPLAAIQEMENLYDINNL